MKRLKKIILPTDLSQNSHRALSYGCWLAAEEHAALLILHVSSFFDAWTACQEDFAWPASDARPWPVDRLLREVTLDLNHFLAPHATELKSLSCAKRVVLGPVPEQIAAVAEEESADLIIMSPKRRRAVRHMIFGGITDKVTRLSPCPVLSITEPKPPIVRPGKMIPALSWPRPRTAAI